MFDKLAQRKNDLVAARESLAEDTKALEEVRGLLEKADERRRLEPDDARKWNRVLENLERSLDLIKARHERSEMAVQVLEREWEQVRTGVLEATEKPLPPASAPALARPELAVADERWAATLERLEALNLEQASALQSQIDTGEIRDEQLEAGLALANQIRPDMEADSRGPEARRQLLLRAAIDKIRKQRFDLMALEEIHMLLACHSLLTSRLEPTPRDQRLRRILDGAIKILRRRKEEMEKR